MFAAGEVITIFNFNCPSGPKPKHFIVLNHLDKDNPCFFVITHSHPDWHRGITPLCNLKHQTFYLKVGSNFVFEKDTVISLSNYFKYDYDLIYAWGKSGRIKQKGFLTDDLFNGLRKCLNQCGTIPLNYQKYIFD